MCRRPAGLLLALCLAGLSAALAAPPGPVPDSGAALELAGAIYARGRAMDYLTVLTDQLGPRLAGTEAYTRAASWAVGQFHAMGVPEVRLEPVVLEHGWQRGSVRGALLGKYPRPLHLASYGWSPSTPSAGLRAPVVVLEESTDAAIAAAHVGGAIVLIDRAVLSGAVAFQHSSPEDWDRTRRYETLDQRLQQAGALGALIHAKAVNQVLRVSAPTEGGRLLALPVASLGREDALLIRRQLEQGPVQVEWAQSNVITGPVTLHNVVAELRGRELPDEWVMFGAHLDCWDFATGAQDNGSGVAEVMDVARAMAQLGTRPRRSLRFVLWAAEEEGENGSKAYVRAHREELDRIVAYLNSDSGAGRPLGWGIAGRADTAAFLKPLVPVLERVGGGKLSNALDFDTDVGAFLVAGVPTFNLDVVDDEYDSVVHHKPADTLDKVDPHALAAAAVMLAVTGEALADSPQRPLSRLGSADVGHILEQTGALEYTRSSSMGYLLR